MEVKRKEGESASAFLYRFTKKFQRSGILREAKKRKHHQRNENKNKRRTAAIYRDEKKREIIKMKKLGKA